MVELYIHSSIRPYDIEFNYLNSGRTLTFSDSLRAFRPTLGLTPPPPPMQCVPGALSQGAKLPGREAHYSPPSSVEVKYGGAIPTHSHVFKT
jgi:hypothetical protein